MRHGQTLFNLQHKIQGWCDAPLTELGKQQAEIAGQYLKNHHIQIQSAYASTSERACDTLEIVLDHSQSYQRKKGLKEWHFGVFEGKDECLNPPLPYGDFFQAFGGEGEAQFQKRIVDTIQDIAQHDEAESILIVSHGAACAQFARYWSRYGVVQYQPGIGNCAIFKYTYDNEIFVLEEIITHDFSGIL